LSVNVGVQPASTDSISLTDKWSCGFITSPYCYCCMKTLLTKYTPMKARRVYSMIYALGALSADSSKYQNAKD